MCLNQISGLHRFWFNLEVRATNKQADKPTNIEAKIIKHLVIASGHSYMI